MRAIDEAINELNVDVEETLADCRAFSIDAKLGQDIQAAGAKLLAADDQVRLVRDSADELEGETRRFAESISQHFEMYAQAHRAVSERELPDYEQLQRHRPLEIASVKKLEVRSGHVVKAPGAGWRPRRMFWAATAAAATQPPFAF